MLQDKDIVIIKEYLDKKDIIADEPIAKVHAKLDLICKQIKINEVFTTESNKIQEEMRGLEHGKSE